MEMRCLKTKHRILVTSGGHLFSVTGWRLPVEVLYVAGGRKHSILQTAAIAEAMSQSCSQMLCAYSSQLVYAYLRTLGVLFCCQSARVATSACYCPTLLHKLLAWAVGEEGK